VACSPGGAGGLAAPSLLSLESGGTSEMGVEGRKGWACGVCRPGGSRLGDSRGRWLMGAGVPLLRAGLRSTGKGVWWLRVRLLGCLDLGLTGWGLELVGWAGWGLGLVGLARKIVKLPDFPTQYENE
jgi:hypothetical protein